MPPVTDSVAGYSTPISPLGRLTVLTVGRGMIEIGNDLVSVCAFASVTVTLTLKLPSAVGDPESSPVLLRDNPGGRVVPDVTVHVSAPEPPVAPSCAL